jgi:hypothetical protein
MPQALFVDEEWCATDAGLDWLAVTRPARFTSADISRAVRAAEKCGLSVARVRVEPNGAIEIVAGEPDRADNVSWFAGSPLYQDKAA